MKQSILLFALALDYLTLSAQSNPYQSAMEKAMVQIDSARGPADFQAAANTFARIAAAEPGQWLPPYYAAFCHLIGAFQLFQEDAPKALLTIDLAQASLDKAKALMPQESEINVMQAYVLIGRLMENPMAKGAEITPKVFAELEQAAAMNPANPRAPFLRGTYVLNMPEFYGGGAANALPYFEKAAGLFEKESDRGLLPHWGKGTNAKYLEQLQQAGKGN
ncbi:MAG: hypothetical protein IPM81_13140 [Saprospirales bacterium]|nr:hypothetical protein [Saprospirales bacterium]